MSGLGWRGLGGNGLEEGRSKRHPGRSASQPLRVSNLDGPWGIKLNGCVSWTGEDSDDLGQIKITDNDVQILQGEVVYGDGSEEVSAGVMRATLEDSHGAMKSVATQITIDRSFIAIRFEGYGAQPSAPGQGDVIYIELNGEGHPVVRIWDDIQEEYAWQSISLEHAVETERE